MNASQTTDLDAMIAAYMPRVVAVFDLDPEDYKLTADSFTHLLEDAAESLDEEGLDSESLLIAAGYMNKAAQSDATGERYRGYTTRALDDVLAARDPA